MSTSAVAPTDRRKGVHLALWGLQVPAQAGLPIVLLAIAGLVAWGRWPRTRALLGR